MLFKNCFQLLGLCVCMVFFSVRSMAQNYWFRHYETDNGLSYNTVNCITQDNKGFMWFGTMDGLNRFDGHNFKIFRTDPTRPNCIGNNFINTIYQDKYNALWIGTHNGLWRYDHQTEKFTLIDFTFVRWIQDITGDNDGNLWFICNGDICKYNLKDNTHRVYKAGLGLSIICDGNGVIWASNSSGYLMEYNSATDSFISYRVLNSSGAATTRIMKIFDTGKGSILLGTRDQGIKLFDIRSATVKDAFSYNTDHAVFTVSDIIRSAADEYWISTSNGIFVYHSGQGVTGHILKNEHDPYSLSDNVVKAMHVDNEGGIWLGTGRGGVNYYNRQNTLFRKYFADNSTNGGNDNVVGEITPDKNNNIWFATENDGVYYLDVKNDRLTRRFPAYKSVTGIFRNDDQLWIGKNEDGMDMVNAETGAVIRSFKAIYNANGSVGKDVITIFRSRSGVILAGTTCGLYHYMPATNSFELVKGVPPFMVTSSITEDHAGNFWAGTYFSGAYFIDGHTLTGKALNIDFSGAGQYNNTVTSICEDNRNNIWFSTESRGIAEYEPSTQKISFCTTAKGLPSNNTFKILKDDDQRLWVSTSAGLARFDPETKAVESFTKSNGLPCDQFNYNSGYKAPDGRLYFGSTHGLISFDPKLIITKNSQRPVFITGIQIENNEVPIGDEKGLSLKKSIINTDTLTLPYNESSFSLDFAALSYVSPGLTRYAYVMDGLDNRWTYLSTNRKAYFTKLPPGTYTFKVKGMTGQGNWGAEKHLLIIVTPPWWLSTWAYAVYVLLGVAGLYIAFYYYRKQEQAENQRLFSMLEHEKDKEIYEAKIDFFTNIAHEIRTPLTLIVAPIEKIQNSDDVAEIHRNAGMVHKNADRLISLTNQLLDFRKTENKDLKLSFIKTDISSFLNESFNSFALSAELKQLDYRLHLPAEALFCFVDHEALTKIVSNLVNNAVKYAGQTVSISLTSSKEQTFSILVSNDGPLIPPGLKEKIFEPFYRGENAQNTGGTGIGLALARSLTTLHGGTLVISENPASNDFILTLPVHQEIEFDFDRTNDSEENLPGQEDNPAYKPAVLLVEDNTEILGFLDNEMHDEYQVYRATNGKSAIDILNKHVVQLIISDVMMPEMNGLELCNYVKNDVELSHIPFILLTAKNGVEAKVEGLGSGADAYLEKPFSPAHLKAQVGSLLVNRQKIQQYFAASPVAAISSIAHNKTDDEFLTKLNSIITEHLDNADLDIDHLAEILCMSRRNLFRKIKAVSGLAPGELINVVRLKKGALLLMEGGMKIYEIASQTGFKSADAFTRNFTKQFGMSPTEYIKTEEMKKRPMVDR